MTDHQAPPSIKWRDEFNTGNASIDHEHREMVRRMNELLASITVEAGDQDVILSTLGDVYAWISAHFALEEMIMRERKYEHYEDHKQDHERLLDDIRDIMDEVKAGEFTGVSSELAGRLHDWFVVHFKTRDADLHRVIGTN